jgi:hypothetical protein
MKRSSKIGTCYQAAIKVTYQDLVALWGQPQKGDGYKTEAEWLIVLPGDKVATIYNYKTSRSWNDKYPEATDVTVWHIGGHRGDVVDLLLGLMGDRATLIDRAQKK